LTLSYAILVATMLAIVIVALTIVAAEILKRPIAEQIDAAARTAQTLVAAAAQRSGPDAAARIVQKISRPGLFVVALPPRPAGAFPPGPPPHNGLRSLLEPAPRHVEFGGSEILIGADPRGIAWAIGVYLKAVAIAIAFVLAMAWLVATWITHQAIGPLIDVTARLQQFARGNFSSHAPMDTREGAEIGRLIAAYNGAATQVAAAFAERALVEEHMRRFVADAGHELRTPLAAIAGAHDILRKSGLADSPLGERIFRTLGSEMQRMDSLIERLIALARLERPEHSQPEIVDVAELANDTIAAVRAARGGTIALTSDPHAVAFADPGDVYDALGNLIDNAVKYGVGSEVAVDIAVDADVVVVRVRDGGPGIPPGDRPHIFELFYRGWIGRSAGGSGLGLAIARRAVERAGGMLELRCGEPGRTTFAFTLPCPASEGS
jgi:two-component system OmpR family sensor kinase